MSAAFIAVLSTWSNSRRSSGSTTTDFTRPSGSNVSFLALAAGALLYVIGEMLGVGRRLSQVITAWGVLAGIVLAFATELVIEAARS